MWFAAPLVDAHERTLADRFRSMIVVGIAIPFALGIAGLLSALSAFVMLAALVVAAWRLQRADESAPPAPALLAVLAAVIVVAWPPLIEPLMEGDSLLYHLPNAAAWAQSHSIWQTNAPEWYYPAASELFAAPMFSFARWSLPLCGLLPGLLLVARLTLWGEELGLTTVGAGLCALALIATPIAAFQLGTLQNDLWLAAFFLESLWLLRTRAAWPALAVMALLKPFGVVFAAIAVVIERRFDLRLLLAFVPLGLWIARDALLAPHAIVAIDAEPGNLWATTIAGNASGAIRAAGMGLTYAGFAVPLFLLLPFVGLALREVRHVAIAGAIAVLLFLVLPFGYSGNGADQLASGAAFRYALPGMACGALVLSGIAVRLRVLGASVAAVVALMGCLAVLAAFHSDLSSLIALGLGPLAVAIAWWDRSPRRVGSIAIAFVVIVGASPYAGLRASGFFSDWMRSPGGVSTHAFDWIAAHHPPRMADWSVRSGSVLLVSPDTRTVDVWSSDPCATARAAHALLFVGTDRDLDPAETLRRRAVASACGHIRFQDEAALIVDPS